jgi:hypothetical protein
LKPLKHVNTCWWSFDFCLITNIGQHMLACMNRLIKSRMLAIPVLSRSALRMVKLGKFPSTGVATPQQDQQVGCPKASLSRDFPLIYICFLLMCLYLYTIIYIYFSIYLYMPERTKNLQFFFSSLTDKDGKFTIGRRLPMGPVCFPYLQWLTPDLQPQGDWKMYVPKEIQRKKDRGILIIADQ